MMRRLLLVLALLGCSNTDAPSAPPGVQAKLQVSDDPEDFTKGNQFSLLATTSLYVRVQVPSLPETTMIHLSILDPDGALFHQEHIPYTRLDQETMVDNPLFHQPMLAWHAEKIDGGWAVLRGVPIRGTRFTSLVHADGMWTVEAVIDGLAGKLSTTVILQP